MYRNLITLENITKTYDNKKNVLEEINLEIKKGEFVAIRGESGSGKSTLMNIIGLLDYASSGDYYFEQKKIKRKGDYAHLRANRIGFIFQSYHLIEGYTVWDNLMMPFLYSRKKMDANAVQEANDILNRLNIYDLKNKSASLLSGGEKQRVAIARALIKKPSLIIADEPTGNLDNENANIINQQFKDISDDGTAIVVVTHSDSIFLNVDKQYEMRQGVLREKNV